VIDWQPYADAMILERQKARADTVAHERERMAELTARSIAARRAKKAAGVLAVLAVPTKGFSEK